MTTDIECNTFLSMPRDEILNLRLTSDVKEAVRLAAEADGRSMSSMAERILREWLIEKGHLKAPGKTGRKGRA
jgi:hypothetical protein